MARAKRKARPHCILRTLFSSLMVLSPGALPRAIPQQTIPQVVLRPNYLKAGVQEASLSVGRPAVTNPSTAPGFATQAGIARLPATHPFLISFLPPYYPPPPFLPVTSASSILLPPWPPFEIALWIQPFKLWPDQILVLLSQHQGIPWCLICFFFFSSPACIRIVMVLTSSSDILLIPVWIKSLGIEAPGWLTWLSI